MIPSYFKILAKQEKFVLSGCKGLILFFQPTGVKFLRLGKLSRIHPDLHTFADEIITKNFTEVEQLSSFYDSMVIYIIYISLGIV